MTEKSESSRFRDLVSSKISLWTFVFTSSLLVFEFVMLSKSRTSLAILSRHFANGDYLRLSFVLALSIVAVFLFSAFVYAAFSSSWKFRAVYFIIFSALILVEYGYYQAFESFFRFQDIEIAIYAKNPAIFSGAVLKYFSYIGFFPIVAFGLFLYLTKKESPSGLKVLLSLVFIFIAFFFSTSYFTKNTFYTHSFNHGVRTLTSFPVIWFFGTFYDSARSDFYYEPREKIAYRSKDRPANNIVLIIDESVRADRLGLNGYEKTTTPMLDELNDQGFIRNWNVAVSGTTCSVSSNALMLTGLRDLPDRGYKVFTLPTIFQYAKALNYKTHYFDGQASSLWNGKASDTADFDEWITADELGKEVENAVDIDAEIAKRVKRIVRESSGKFIWINKFGVHQSSLNSYPNQETTISDKYDAAIRYNSESFFRELSKDGFDSNTVFIYTSDHGRNLDQTAGKATHCSNTKAEASVPLFIISSKENLGAFDTAYKASHSNIFGTLLDLMKFPDEERKYDYAISLQRAKSSDSKKRFYFVGDLHRAGEGRLYPFD